MAGEREKASEMLVRHERELRQFVVDQAKRLDDAGFDWDLPMEFRVKHALTGGGLPIVDATREELLSGEFSIILHPSRRLLLVDCEGHAGEYRAEYIPIRLFGEIEQKVNETLASLQVAKVPA